VRACDNVSNVGSGPEDARDRLAVIGEIAAEIAHELRNVLQVITASAYVARQDPAAGLPHILKIEKNARLAHAIVDDLMSLARGEPTHAEPVLLYDIVVAARTEIEPGVANWEDAIEVFACARMRVSPRVSFMCSSKTRSTPRHLRRPPSRHARRSIPEIS
jgi:signal transduction histidine kinase